MCLQSHNASLKCLPMADGDLNLEILIVDQKSPAMTAETYFRVFDWLEALARQ